MSNENFSSMNDIKVYLSSLLEEEKVIDKEISELSRDKFNLKLLYRYLALREKKNIVLSKIVGCNALIRDLTSFNCDLLLGFLVKYLSYKEKEIYVYFKNVRESKRSILTQSSCYSSYLPMSNYNIVTTNDNYHRMISQTKPLMPLSDTDNIYAYLRCCEDHKYICLLNDHTYSIMDGLDLAPEFRNFPELLYVAESLVDMGLAHPEMSAEYKLSVILDKARYSETCRKRKE